MSLTHLNRRGVLAGGAALIASPDAARSAGPPPIYIADMHVHLFFVGPKPAHTQPLAANMARGKATLVSWSLVGDQPWLKIAPGGFAPNGKPARGQASTWLRDEAARAKAHLAEQNLPLVRTAADVAKSLEGQPHVVLSVEGATFADQDLDQLKTAYDFGIRHVQLVHFLDNAIGDIQTAAPVHGGLTRHGRSLIEACNRLGILIDLAHCTERVVDEVLEISTVPVVWSHSSVAVWKFRWPFSLPAFARRQLSASAAARISSKGGVVGLWALGADVGASVEGYTDRILELSDRLGENHVAFGTDMNALSRPALTSYADLRRVVELMLKRGRSDATVRNIAIGNYARLLTVAMNAKATAPG